MKFKKHKYRTFNWLGTSVIKPEKEQPKGKCIKFFWLHIYESLCCYTVVIEKGFSRLMTCGASNTAACDESEGEACQRLYYSSRGKKWKR